MKQLTHVVRKSWVEVASSAPGVKASSMAFLLSAGDSNQSRCFRILTAGGC
jgi:hypothetical protein